MTYPSPGAPDLARRVEERLGPELGRAPGRGLDHGVWTPLVHMLPGADVPVLQLSLPRDRDRAGLVELGTRLRPLRDEGVWIMASGSLTHDLKSLGPDGTEPPAPARDFDRWTARRIEADDRAVLLGVEEARPDFRAHHPTPEHWDVLYVALGAADPADPVGFPAEGFEYRCISRRSVQWG